MLNKENQENYYSNKLELVGPSFEELSLEEMEGFKVVEMFRLRQLQHVYHRLRSRALFSANFVNYILRGLVKLAPYT